MSTNICFVLVLQDHSICIFLLSFSRQTCKIYQFEFQTLCISLSNLKETISPWTHSIKFRHAPSNPVLPNIPILLFEILQDCSASYIAITILQINLDTDKFCRQSEDFSLLNLFLSLTTAQNLRMVLKITQSLKIWRIRETFKGNEIVTLLGCIL